MDNWTDIRSALATVAPDHAEKLNAFEKPEDFISHAMRADPDWRKQAAGEDENVYKELERFSDPGQLYKSFDETRKALRDGGRVKVPGENATPEERAAFHRALGVPEKPDDYKITAAPPQGYEVSEDDKAFLSETTKRLHEAGAPPQFVNLAHELYYGAAAKSEAERQERAEQSLLASEKALESIWGARKSENIGWANAAVDQFFPGEVNENGNKDLVDLPVATPDGFVGALGDWPPFVQMMAMIGRQNVEDPYFLKAAGATGAADPEARKREIMGLRDTNPQEYARLAADGGELDKINAAILRRQQRGAAGR